MDERSRAKNYALRLLSQRSYSSHQLRVKMLSKGFSEQIISEWIEWLRSVELLHDDRYLQYAVERELKKGYGPRAIVWKLRSLGFAAELIEDEIARIAPIQRQKEIIRNWADRKGDLRKAAADLMRRGFDCNLVLDALRESP